MNREVIKATAWGLLVTMILGLLIVIGSRNLAHFDAALVAYTFAVLFATFGLTYRYAMWLQRPPTAVYWRQGWRTFFRMGDWRNQARHWGYWVFNDIVINRFIWSREWLRGLTHSLIMWGCVLAIAITFPLVFGWLHFQAIPDQLEWYRAYIFGFPTFAFPVESIAGFLLFHGLVWSSFLVIAGVMLAMRRRMREEGAAAVQLFAEDFLPLILLFAVSVTGLMLTASYTWLKGYAYDFLAILHAITVIATFLWLPFGKFFHIFQRPAQIGVRFYKEVGEQEEAALCRRCGHPFTSRLHVEDLIHTEKALGYRYEMPNNPVEHYQWICPPCRRAMFAAAQGRLWDGIRGGSPLGDFDTPVPVIGATDGAPITRQPMPVYANPGIGEGPLGSEDARNFHP
ncbi:MAG: MFS transporter [Caldilineaceae bacterium]|nr:MFS transporter [Caldilineaceae bacterium]